MRLVLASGSPRRAELLASVGFSFDVRPTHAPEPERPELHPAQQAQRLAADKLAASNSTGVVLAADTIVHRARTVWGKPNSREHAAQILSALSGGWHEVTTGVSIGGRSPCGFSVTTRVRFRALSAYEIDRYVASGEADDKAGAYGIQGGAGAFVAELHGSWTNVMGLPMEQTIAALVERGCTRQ